MASDAGPIGSDARLFAAPTFVVALALSGLGYFPPWMIALLLATASRPAETRHAGISLFIVHHDLPA